MSSDLSRRGGRAARRKLRLQAPIVMAPALVRNVPPYEVLDAEGVELLHDAPLAIPEEAKERLKALTPAGYTGNAGKQARAI